MTNVWKDQSVAEFLGRKYPETMPRRGTTVEVKWPAHLSHKNVRASRYTPAEWSEQVFGTPRGDALARIEAYCQRRRAEGRDAEPQV